MRILDGHDEGTQSSASARAFGFHGPVGENPVNAIQSEEDDERTW